MLMLTKLLHSAFGQISTIVSYDAMWEAKTKNHLFYELNRRGCITLTGSTSTHFVNLSTATKRCVFLSLDLLKGPTMSSPQTANGQVIGIIRNS